ncbi:MAG: hypothetical protein IPK04_20360 [Bdellovibrionales bacterium]|nr:hypothetical protein [Bdellovibrionales bacterium]
MGLTVTVLDSEKIEIFFRLAENRNHKGTAFGEANIQLAHWLVMVFF